MILEQKQTTDIKTSEKFKELEFGIRSSDMGLVLEILRSKLYRNPIAAICREVASNARDANREAENNVPIEISIDDGLFSPGDLTISFKDVGPGISPERMADVFVNYGASTKRDDNVQTGGFGIGAKTPFSYTDNFSIVTIVDKVKYTYMAAIEEGNRGKIYLVSDEETPEQNGTSIIVPIKPQDRSYFEREVYRATIFWGMRPVYKNFRINPKDVAPQVLHEDEHFLIVKQQLLDDHFGLLLDGIFYSIDTNIMRFAYDNFGALFVLKFGIGELTISANRETVQYDDDTKKAINLRFVELINLAKEKYETEFGKCKTWLEASLFKQATANNHYYRLLSHHLQSSDPWLKMINSFKGTTLTKNLQSVFATFGFYRCERDRNERLSRTKISELTPKFVDSPIYFFDETASFIPAKDTTILASHDSYIAIRVDSKLLKWSTLPYKQKRQEAKAMRAYLNDIKHLKEYGFTYALYSTVERMKVPKDKSNAAPKIQHTDTIKVFLHDAGVNMCRRPGRSSSGSYCYLKVDDKSVTYESGSPLDRKEYALVLVDDILQIPKDVGIDEMYKIAVKNDFIPSFHIIYANRKRGVKLMGLIPMLDEKLKLLTNDIITKIIDRHHIKELIGNSSYLLKIDYVSKEFSETMATLVSLSSSKNDRIHVPDYLVTKYKHLSKMDDLRAAYRRIKVACPLLSTFNDYSYSGHLKDIVHYINLVENAAIAEGTLTKK